MVKDGDEVSVRSSATGEGLAGSREWGVEASALQGLKVDTRVEKCSLPSPTARQMTLRGNRSPDNTKLPILKN